MYIQPHTTTHNYAEAHTATHQHLLWQLLPAPLKPVAHFIPLHTSLFVIFI